MKYGKQIKDIPALFKPKDHTISYGGQLFENFNAMPEMYKLFKKLTETTEPDIEHKSTDDIIPATESTKRYIKNKAKSVRLQQFKQYTGL